MRTTVPKDLLQGELMGLHARVAEARDPNQPGLEGLVADETRNTLVILTAAGMKRLPKRGMVLEFSAPTPEGGPGEFTRLLECGRLMSRPEDRIKKNAPRNKMRGRGTRHFRRAYPKGESPGAPKDPRTPPVQNQ